MPLRVAKPVLNRLKPPAQPEALTLRGPGPGTHDAPALRYD